MAESRTGWSLRSRVVAALALTVILLSGVIAAIALTTLRASLVQQLDGELRMVASRVMSLGSGSLPGGPDQSMQGPGITPDARVIVGDGSGWSGAYLDEDYTVQPMTQQSVDRVVSSWGAGPQHEIDLGDGQGRYRFSSEARGPVTVVVGLPLDGVEQTMSTVALTMGGVAVGGGVLLGVLAAWYIRREMRPLERVAAAAERIATTPLDRGSVELQAVEAPESGSAQEIGRLVSGFNAMIDQVGGAFRARQESEDKVRRFVADASHELRTPLASIRGYSELTRRMADALPQDAVYALGRIESESVRMTRLVEDLLLLARLDEGTELSLEPLDLAELVDHAVNDARVAGPDHEWVLSRPGHPVTVVGDAGRLQQILANLLANARVHTPAGTRVEVVLRETADRVLVEVVDDGPGIPEDQLPTLFARFARGDASRARATGSTGLGLAIVEAIASGHGGGVSVTSAPGETRFSVELPRPGDEPLLAAAAE